MMRPIPKDPIRVGGSPLVDGADHYRVEMSPSVSICSLRTSSVTVSSP